jgi:hypothetical protein
MEGTKMSKDEEETLVDPLKATLEKSGAEILGTIGLDNATFRRWAQAIAFGATVGTSTIGWLTFYPDKTPYVCLILGSMAVAIAVQQLYLFEASDNKQAKRAYLWGALALIFLGVSSVISSMNLGVMASPINAKLISSLPLPLLYMGMVFLYRFVIMYLYTDVEQDIIYPNFITIFTSKALMSKTVDICLLLAAVIIMGLSFGFPGAFERDPAFLAKQNVSTYLMLNKLSAITFIVFLIVTYLMCLVHFIRRFRFLNEGDVIVSTLSFFQCMIKAFYFATIAQCLYLAIQYFDINPLGSPSSMDAAATVVVFVLGVVYLVIPFALNGVLKDKFKCRICLSTWTVTLPIGMWCILASNVFGNIPMPYITLGLLTLGFAYLPANDLINLRNNARG